MAVGEWDGAVLGAASAFVLKWGRGEQGPQECGGGDTHEEPCLMCDLDSVIRSKGKLEIPELK